MLEKELMLQKNQQNSNNYFYNSINQINNKDKSYDINDNNINQNEYLDNNNYKNNYNYNLYQDEPIRKNIRSKSNVRITSNNRFSHEKNNSDLSMISTPSCDKSKKKKTKKKKKNPFVINKIQNQNNIGDLSNYYNNDERNSQQSYSYNTNNKNSSKKVNKKKGKKIIGNGNKINHKIKK